MLRLLQRITRVSPQPGAGVLAVSPAGRVSLNSEGAVFLQVETGVVFRSNRIGARIWQGVVERQTPETIAAALSREHGVAQEVVARDTARFLSELESAGFLARHHG